MGKLRKIFLIMLLIILIITGLVYFFPETSKILGGLTKMTDDQLSNCLTFVDILISTILSIGVWIDQKKAEKRCTYDFGIEQNNLSFHNYIRVPDETNCTFKYVYERKAEDDMDTPYYGMDIEMAENALCSVGIPLWMTVSTELHGNRIKFSKLKIFIKNDSLLKYKIKRGTIIEKPIENGKKFLIRIRLLCDHNLEKELLNSRIYICSTIELEDDKKQKYKKYIILEIQNILGNSQILSIYSRNSIFTYRRKIHKLNKQLVLNT